MRGDAQRLAERKKPDTIKQRAASSPVFAGVTECGRQTDGRPNMLKALKSLTDMDEADLLPIPVPGELLLEDFLKPGLSQNALSH